MVEFLGDFTRRTLASLGRFREADPPAPLPFGTPGVIADADFNAWERCKANMALDQLEHWNKMNLAEARRIETFCGSCGEPEVGGRCARCSNWDTRRV